MGEVAFADSFSGTLIFAAGGCAGAVFALPFRKIKGWSFESYWLFYAVAGLVLSPVVLAMATVPNVFSVISSAPSSTLLRCFGFGALWGIGGLTWGLMIRYLGIGLGLAVGCGICSATGTLIPPLVTGHAADLIKDRAAVVVLSGVLLSLLGIVFVGLAGKSKSDELPDEEKRKAVADFNFSKGMLLALFSGVASAGMNFGLQGGGALEEAARAMGTPAKWAGFPVLVVVLAGGFVVNASWCLWQNSKNRTFGDYRTGGTACAANIFWASIAGVVWALQFACQKVGEPLMGEMRYISFAVVMASSIFFSTLLGIKLGEWNGVSRRTKIMLAAGILVLVASFVIISLGKRV